MAPPLRGASRLTSPSSSSAALTARDVSMVCANFRNPDAFEKVLFDWIDFIGGRPGEIVVVDGGSDRRTHELYFDLMGRGVIDKLQLIRPDHPDNHRDTCYLQEHQAPAIASGKYVLFWKSDTLPYRSGHEDWLSEALASLDRDDTFAFGGSFNIPSKHHEAWPGFYFSDRCSLNFSVMKRSSYIAAMEEFAGEYISSGFRTPSPAAETGQSRYLMEVAFERYIERHRKYTLCRYEDDTWTVFHTNAQGDRLLELREKYLRRIDVAPYFNAGRNIPLNGGSYYGRKRKILFEARVALGRYRRLLWHRLTGAPTGLPDTPLYLRKAAEAKQRLSQEVAG